MADTQQELYATTFIHRQHDQIRDLFGAVEQAAPEERAEAFSQRCLSRSLRGGAIHMLDERAGR